MKYLSSKTLSGGFLTQARARMQEKKALPDRGYCPVADWEVANVVLARWIRV